MKGMVEMGKLSALVGLAALAGVGFYVGKKLLEKNAAEKEQRERDFDESEVFVEEKHSTPKEKIQKASLFAVGAIKTGTEKFKEGIDEIINKDMVAKGEDTVAKTKEFAKETKDKTVEFAKDENERNNNSRLHLLDVIHNSSELYERTCKRVRKDTDSSFVCDMCQHFTVCKDLKEKVQKRYP